MDYVGSKIRKSTLTDFLRPGIFDATENLDPNSSYTVHKDEYVDGWQDKGSYALLASSTTLQNNTLYYFTKDVMIGDVSVPI